MPPFDEKGGMIDLNGPFSLRGDDAKEYILPGSIPIIGETCVSDPEEHDCLPPLEALTSEGWLLSDRLAEKLLETIAAFEEADEKIPKTVLIKTVNDFSQELEAEGIINPPAIVEHTTSWREMRRCARWNERNRRRMLKGLPEKPNPYPRAVAFTYVVNLNPTGPIDIGFEME